MLNFINIIRKIFSVSRTKSYNPITIVDEYDKVIGYEDLFAAIRKGALRRVVRVLVFDTEGNILIQRRSRYVLSPLKLDQSAAGHVDKGESYDSAAERELQEELGISGYPLTLVTPPFRTSRFFNAVYVVKVPPHVHLHINREEVESVRWLRFHDFLQMMKNSPHEFTGSFLEAWHHVYDKIQVP